MKDFSRLISAICLISPLITQDAEALIETSDMAPVNAETSGLLQETTASFPLTLWKGLKHEQVVSLWKHLPSSQKNPVLASLQHRLLLASLQVPEGGSSSSDSALALRVEILGKSGYLESAYLLGSRAPQALGEGNWEWVEFSYYLALDNYKQALNIAQKALQKDPENSRWIKAVITIHLLKSEKESALLALSLLEEKGHLEDKNFIQQTKSKLQGNLFGTSFHPQDNLEIKLWVEEALGAGHTIPDEFLSFSVMAKSFHSLPLKEKLLLAERAFKRGILSLEMLKQYYQEYASHNKASSPTALPDDLISLEEVPLIIERNDPLMRSTLLKALAEAPHEQKKAEVLGQFAQHLLMHNHLEFSPLIMEMLRALPVRPEWSKHAASFCRLLLNHGEKAKAVRWLSLASLEEKISLAPWIILTLDHISLEAKQSLFSKWYTIYEKTHPDVNDRLRALGLFEAFVPGVTMHLALSFPEFLNASPSNTPLPFAPLYNVWGNQPGLSLVYMLVLGNEIFQSSSNSCFVPFFVKALGTLGYQREATELALFLLARKTEDGPL